MLALIADIARVHHDTHEESVVLGVARRISLVNHRRNAILSSEVCGDVRGKDDLADHVQHRLKVL